MSVKNGAFLILAGIGFKNGTSGKDKDLKKIAAMILVLFGFAVPGRAVTLASKGIRAGLSVASFPRLSRSFEYHSRLGYVFGLFASFNISRGFSAQPELLVIEKGGNGSGGSGADAWSDRIRLTYLEIPVLARYYYPLDQKRTLYGYGGPAISFLLGTHRRWEEGGESGAGNMGIVRGIDYGFILGECLEWRIGKNVVAVDIRYTIGLSQCFDKTSPTDPTVRNGALQVLIGYGF